jgi:lysophospholipase L1-like esterase
MLELSRNDRLLFIGDSITDCGRRGEHAPLGSGYVKNVHHWLLARQPGAMPTVINRGIGGNTIRDLDSRWQADVLDVRPTVVSIKIGINDVWRQLDGKGEGVKLPEFVDTYRRLLDRLDETTRVVLCEPSVISPPAPNGNAMVSEYAAAVRELGEERGLTIVPMHRACREAETKRPDVTWWADGVHPTEAGHWLLARTWLVATGLL